MSENLPVVMCTWKKPERLPKTMECLSDSTVDVEFYIWNNNSEINDRIELIVDEYFGNIPIEITHSEENVAGMGRFYLCRDKSIEGPVVFIDDDQVFGVRFIESLLEDYHKNGGSKLLISQYAHGYSGDDYWTDRVRLERGEEAVYCGTCGMIADSSIFCGGSKVFEYPKPAYYTMEDMWLSFVAKEACGWKLLKGGNCNTEEISSNISTHPNFKEEKREFFKNLREGSFNLRG